MLFVMFVPFLHDFIFLSALFPVPFHVPFRVLVTTGSLIYTFTGRYKVYYSVTALTALTASVFFVVFFFFFFFFFFYLFRVNLFSEGQQNKLHRVPNPESVSIPLTYVGLNIN